ncbi:MAG: hypothetical protein EZS28_013805 [Streblomastix strix]|uniref:Uncharacterized protein n=1 Tax=Streblomastix strix TaxID=222440 RepID=A0A5J4W6V9_9EUKA|nr:MAG: hypothetical protein EZS28_013805 [Streblomastix strix]
MLIIPNCINGGNNATKQKERDEDQIKSIDPNGKLMINYDNQKFCIFDWRNQLSSISILSNITLDELSEQRKNQSSSQRWMGSICEVEQTNSEEFVNNHYLDQTKQIKTIERSNPEHNPDDICQRGWLEHDVVSFQRINIERWPMGGFLASSLQYLKRTSSSTNLATKSTTNTNRLGNEMHSSQDGQYNNGVCDMQMEGSICNATSREREIFLLLNNLDIIVNTEYLPGMENSSADALSRLSWIGDKQFNPVLLNEALQQINFQFTLDAFAHKTNKQLKKYCSLYEDNKTIARNALNIPWTSELLLQHPPKGLIPKVIQKTIRDQVEAVLILPRKCLYKYRTMLPPIQNQVSVGPSDQVQIKAKTMKEFTKLPPGIIEMIKINTKKESNYTENLQNQQRQIQLQQNN